MQLGFFDLLQSQRATGLMHEFSRFMQSEVVRTLIGTNAFNRLRGIKFLGAIDYVVWPTGRPKRYRHNRYEHSLSVAFIADRVGSRDLSPKERRLFLAASLLHDVGHAPLSHSMEPAFFERFGINHHIATIDMILGRSPLGDSVLSALKHLDISIDALINILDNKTSAPFFSGPINFDTIDGISRAKSYFTNSSISSDINTCVRAIYDMNFDNLDDFWITKDIVYKYFINGEVGLLADSCANSFALQVSENRLNRDSYFLSEERFRRSFPDLFEELSSLRRNMNLIPASSKARNTREYKVNRNSHVLSDRYITIKHPRLYDYNSLEFVSRRSLCSGIIDQLELDLHGQQPQDASRNNPRT